MSISRVFRSGNGRAVRLPKELRFKGKEVEIFRRGNEIVLRERNSNLSRAFDLLAELPRDVKPWGRGKDYPQKRKGL